MLLLTGCGVIGPRLVKTGDMVEARSGHSAFLLSDGQLIMGGRVPFPNGSFEHFTNSVEIYNPSKGTFKNLAPPIDLPCCISKPSDIDLEWGAWQKVLLADDRVFMTGGAIWSKNPKYLYYGSHIYDPKTGITSHVKSMLISRRNSHAMISLVMEEY